MTQKWVELLILVIGAGLLTGILYLTARLTGALKSELELSIELAEKCIWLCGLKRGDGKGAITRRTLERNLMRISRYMNLYGERHSGVSVTTEIQAAKAALEDAIDDVYDDSASEAFAQLLDSLKGAV